jgi:enoyl-CoA hydratase
MPNIGLTIDRGVASLTIDRAAKLNSLDVDTVLELRDAVSRLARLVAAAGERPRVVLVSGAGERAFVSGADIAAMAEMSVEAARSFSQLGHETLDALEALPMLVVAVVQGVALGGGLELALACDLVLASDRAKFGQPETNLGIIPGFGGCSRLLRRIGVGTARELIYSGRIIAADEALRLGLVQRVVPAADLRSAAEAWARDLAQRPPLAIAHAKAALAAAESGEARLAARVEIEAFAGLFASRDQREGMSAFLAKRAPTFEGA